MTQVSENFALHKEVAEAAARAAGAVHLKYRGTGVDIETKGGDPRNLVTRVDREAQEAAKDVIRLAFPDAVFIGEEDGLSDDEIRARMSDCWCIDGLDGTFAFVRDLPFFGAAVGYVRDGMAMAGGVFMTAHGEALSAARGLGATADGRPISVSGRKELAEAFIGVMGGPRTDEDKRHYEKRIARMLPATHGLRIFGPPAIELAYVATGRLDAYVTVCPVRNMGPWDLAGASVIVEEAGGLVSDHGGAPFDLLSKHAVAAATPELHAALLDITERADD